ncbi:DUF397 domain-containing protein [Streptomyces sp. NPDC001340]
MSVEQVHENVDELRWFKSSYSGSGGGNCVEVAVTPGRVWIRDSKDTGRPGLRVASTSWTEFVAYACD